MTDKKNDKTDNTTAKQLQPFQFKPGQTGNPTGRPKGSRNQFSEAFLKDIHTEWVEHGKEVLKAVRTEDPSTFLRVAASIIPKEFTVKEDNTSLERLLEQHSVEELDKLINGLVTLGSARTGAKDEKKERPTNKPDIIH